MDTSKITDVLIFKGGYYWLTVKESFIKEGVCECEAEKEPHYHNPPQKFYCYRIAQAEKNGFEFASDAYAYIASLSPLREPRKNGVHLDMTDEVYDKEEERLKEMGEV